MPISDKSPCDTPAPATVAAQCRDCHRCYDLDALAFEIRRHPKCPHCCGPLERTSDFARRLGLRVTIIVKPDPLLDKLRRAMIEAIRAHKRPAPCL